MKIKNMFSVSLLIVLLVSFVPLSTLSGIQVASAETDTSTYSTYTLNDSSEPVFTPIKIVGEEGGLKGFTIDTTQYFLDLGYTKEELAKMSEDELFKVLRGGKEYPFNSLEDVYQYLFGNSTGPISEESSSALPTRQGGKGCIVIAIWDYPGTLNDVAAVNTMYTSIMYNINNGGYSGYGGGVTTITNSAATHANIASYITWGCAEYSTLDVYFYGHGANPIVSGVTTYGYCSYDSLDANGNLNAANLYRANEMQSGTLRFGLGSFCYGGRFAATFTSGGGNVWIGPAGEVAADYASVYTSYWGYNWYQLSVISNLAHNYAHGNASAYAYGYSTFTHTGTAIYN